MRIDDDEVKRATVHLLGAKPRKPGSWHRGSVAARGGYPRNSRLSGFLDGATSLFGIKAFEHLLEPKVLCAKLFSQQPLQALVVCVQRG